MINAIVGISLGILLAFICFGAGYVIESIALNKTRKTNESLTLDIWTPREIETVEHEVLSPEFFKIFDNIHSKDCITCYPPVPSPNHGILYQDYLRTNRELRKHLLDLNDTYQPTRAQQSLDDLVECKTCKKKQNQEEAKQRAERFF